MEQNKRAFALLLRIESELVMEPQTFGGGVCADVT